MSEIDSAGTPDWVAKPLRAFLEYHKRIHDFYHFSIAGFQMAVFGVARQDELIADLKKLDEKAGVRGRKYPYPDDSERNRAAKAKAELDKGLPTLHESQTVLLWSSLEWLVEDFVVNLLSQKPELLKLETIQRIRITLAEYARLEGDERYRYIVGELQRESKIAFRSGIDKFETLLGPFGMAGVVEAHTKRDLMELENVRNVLVHRRGVADSRLVRNCPWMGLSVGENVPVATSSFERYYNAVFDYVGVLVARVQRAGF